MQPHSAVEQPAPTACCAPMLPDSPLSRLAACKSPASRSPLMGRGQADPRVGRRFSLLSDRRSDDRCARTVIVGMLSMQCAQYVALLVIVEPVEGQATLGRVVGNPTGLICDPCRKGELLSPPVAECCGGKLALVPVGYRGG